MISGILCILLGSFALLVVSTPDIDQGSPFAALTDQVFRRIAPATASCDDAEFPNECADASRAAVAINKAFETYGISSLGQQAGLVAYMLFESGNFKYNRNHYPGRPGQGTRMMAMPPLVKLYATSIAGAEAVEMAEAAGGNAGLDAVLGLANCNDEKSFGSAAWFLSRQCTASIQTGLATGGIDGWHNFLTACVNTTIVAGRDTLWLATTEIMSGAE
ncbi:hypothetical protein DDE82_009072 [Stemphylium lycopersici]|uniref:Uncharacterized protein n=1 Tax=Stemphylium lycopersici TaxID=183478 RepID=A0A364MRK9_STELY|nr:hypothetical protein TW65_08972 [Stemphylium lycopersici]RAQ98621.1 hypothetical protein DDE82_009072 [Stemphylium lycopersici]RAR00940.1 hypothetical protein DDE83_009022 [Stemphylium lycopersici]